MTQYDPKELKTVSVSLNPDKVMTQIKVHPNQKLWQLKVKMANAFKLRLSEFYIKTRQGPLDEQYYDELVKDYKIESLFINRVPTETIEKEFPRYLIGYNSEYLGLFLELLETGKEECKREVLSLLEILPINVDYKIYLKDHILKLSAQSPVQEWNQLFSWNGQNMAKPCYFLMSLEDLMISRKDSPNPEQVQQEVQQKQEFTLKLLQNGGFFYLFEMFINMDKKSLERNVIKTKLLAILLKLLANLFLLKQTSVFKQSVTSTQIDKLVFETLTLVESFIMTVRTQ